MSEQPKPAPTEKKQEMEARVEPSGYYGGNPSTAGPGPTAVHTNTPENAAGHLNPTAPGDTGTTPGSTADE